MTPPVQSLLWFSKNCLLDDSSGASKTVRMLLTQLAKRGVQIHIVGATVFDAEPPPWAIRILNDSKTLLVVQDDDGLIHHLVKTRSWNIRELLDEECDRLYSLYLKMLDTVHPDVLHFQGGRSLEMLVCSEAKRRGLKVFARIANGSYLSKAPWHKDVDRFVTNTHANADYYRAHTGLQLDPIGLFIDPRVCVAEHHTRQRLLFINPSLEKGGAVVASMALWLHQHRPDIHLDIVEGRGKWSDTLTFTCETLGVHAPKLTQCHVHLLQSDMRPFYGRARLLLAPSLWWETAGRVVVESLLNGVPVLCSNHGGMPELLKGGGLAIDFDPLMHQPPYTAVPNAQALKPLLHFICRCYDDASFYAEWVQRAHSAKAWHNIDHNTQRFLDLLNHSSSA